MIAAEKLTNLRNAEHQLAGWGSEVEKSTSLVLIQERQGKGVTDYYRVFLFFTQSGRVERTELTWAIGQVFSHSLRDLEGSWHLAISGGGFDKRLEIVRLLEKYYGITGINFGRI